MLGRHKAYDALIEEGTIPRSDVLNVVTAIEVTGVCPQPFPLLFDPLRRLGKAKGQRPLHGSAG